MKVTDKGTYTEIELETPSGKANFMASLKSDIEGDKRSWQRDPETVELNQYMADNKVGGTQFVVNTNGTFVRVR